MLPEVVATKDIAVCACVTTLVHLLNPWNKASRLRVEVIHNVVGLLVQDMLDLIEAMFYEFLRHHSCFDVRLVRLRESHTEPLRAVASFIDEDSLS